MGLLVRTYTLSKYCTLLSKANNNAVLDGTLIRYYNNRYRFGRSERCGFFIREYTNGKGKSTESDKITIKPTIPINKAVEAAKTAEASAAGKPIIQVIAPNLKKDDTTGLLKGDAKVVLEGTIENVKEKSLQSDENKIGKDKVNLEKTDKDTNLGSKINQIKEKALDGVKEITDAKPTILVITKPSSSPSPSTSSTSTTTLPPPPPSPPPPTKKRKRVDHTTTSLERNFITPVRAMSDFLLKPSDLEHLPKNKRRSPFESEPPITVYWRRDVQAKAMEVWGSMDAMRAEHMRREIDRKKYQQTIWRKMFLWMYRNLTKLFMKNEPRVKKKIIRAVSTINKQMKKLDSRKSNVVKADNKNLNFVYSDSERTKILQAAVNAVIYNIENNGLTYRYDSSMPLKHLWRDFKDLRNVEKDLKNINDFNKICQFKFLVELIDIKHLESILKKLKDIQEKIDKESVKDVTDSTVKDKLAIDSKEIQDRKVIVTDLIAIGTRVLDQEVKHQEHIKACKNKRFDENDDEKDSLEKVDVNRKPRREMTVEELIEDEARARARVKRRVRDFRREMGKSADAMDIEAGLMGRSGKVVLMAVAINSTNFAFKLGAWIMTGSHSMFSECIHSLADTINQLILAYGIHKSVQVADTDHPYGYTNMKYVASLISGVGIFCVGTGLSVYHGIAGLIDPHPVQDLFWGYCVLGGSLISEGATWWVAFNSIRKGARECHMSFKEYIFRGQDPSVNVVLLEDAAAVIGVTVAATCMGLSTFYNSHIPDAVGSLLVGGILGGVASFIIYTNVAALVGRSIPQDSLKQMNLELESDVMVRAIHDVKGIDMGNCLVRYKAEMDFDGRELTKFYLDKADLSVLLQEVKHFETVDQLEEFLLKHGESIIDLMGGEIDRIEIKLRTKHPEIRHCDLEIL